MYCPKCRSEFRPDVAHCANCEVDLVENLPETDPFETAEGMAELIQDREVQALFVGNHVALLEVQKILAKERIPSVIAGEAAEELEAAMHARFYLMIAEEQLEAAKAVVASRWEAGLEQEGLMLKDASAVKAEVAEGSDAVEGGDAPCPACGHVVPATVGECPECGLFVGVAEE